MTASASAHWLSSNMAVRCAPLLAGSEGRTIEMFELFMQGIRDTSWTEDTLWERTPEGGLRVSTGGRDIIDRRGYFEFYFHLYYVDLFVQPSDRSLHEYKFQEWSVRTEQNWDEPFPWQRLNACLVMVQE